MKLTINYSVKVFWLAFALLSAALVLVAGCNARTATWPYHLAEAFKPRLGRNPLEGWQSYKKDQLDQVIARDYNEYIQQLPTEERRVVNAYLIDAFEDEMGQHAVSIEINLHGTEWRHILIYKKNNKRMKVIKYASGHYRS